jgi:hypothetical protein
VSGIGEHKDNDVVQVGLVGCPATIALSGAGSCG